MKNMKKQFFAILLLTGLIMSGCDDLFNSSSNNSNNYGSVTVTPGSVTLARGETQQFTASESYGVEWSLEGATGSSIISSSGLLTVGLDEIAATLTVKASKSNYTAGTARVTVASPGATPTGLKVTKPGPNSIVLSWSALTGNTQYTVYRSTNGTSFGPIATVASTSYTDTAVITGSSYYYRINANGVNSSVVFTYADDYFNMPVFSQRKTIPINISNKHYYRFWMNSGDESTIQWQDGDNKDITSWSSYDPRLTVYAYQNNGTQIFSRNSYSNRDGYTNPQVFTATSTGYVTMVVEYTNGTIQNYQIYSYGLNMVEDTGTVALPPYQVSTFKVNSPASDSINLTWDSVSDAVKYNIYRSTSQTGSLSNRGYSDNTSFTDIQTIAGELYWYTIAAVNADGREGCRYQGAFGIAAPHYTLSNYSSAQTLSINSGGKHYYRLEVTKDTSYTIQWQDGDNKDISSWTSYDPRFTVYAYQNNGTQIFSRNSYSNRDGYTNPQVFTATSTGYVTIVVEYTQGTSQNYQIYYN